jgi:hypothetical protein
LVLGFVRHDKLYPTNNSRSNPGNHSAKLAM